ncbi:MAG: zinc metallopeptidase [Thermoguttaceae bacterium]
MVNSVLQPLLVLALLIAVNLVKRARRNSPSVFQHFAGERAACGMSGRAAARRLLDALGLSEVAVLATRRRFSHYRPWRRQVCLNEGAFDNTSLPAVVTAAHEVGHAQQFADGCWPARAYRVLWPLLCLLVMGLIAPPLGSVVSDLAGFNLRFSCGVPWFGLPLVFVLVMLTGTKPSTVGIRRHTTRETNRRTSWTDCPRREAGL